MGRTQAYGVEQPCGQVLEPQLSGAGCAVSVCKSQGAASPRQYQCPGTAGFWVLCCGGQAGCHC